MTFLQIPHLTFHTQTDTEATRVSTHYPLNVFSCFCCFCGVSSSLLPQLLGHWNICKTTKLEMPYRFRSLIWLEVERKQTKERNIHFSVSWSTVAKVNKIHQIKKRIISRCVGEVFNIFRMIMRCIYATRYLLCVSHRNIAVGPKDYLHSYAACRECVCVCVYFVELLVDHLA